MAISTISDLLEATRVADESLYRYAQPIGFSYHLSISPTITLQMLTDVETLLQYSRWHRALDSTEPFRQLVNNDYAVWLRRI